PDGTGGAADAGGAAGAGGGRGAGGAPGPAGDVDPAPYLVQLAGPSGQVSVVAPPGRTADVEPHWTSTTDLGADPPSFATLA
ncbi:hypothetical protein ICW40_07075, partial [Actinotalea ferrariae]|nr:hypothetical protein [Actinotalea ferrariae]